MKQYISAFAVLSILFLIEVQNSGCKKYLEKKPDQQLALLTSVNELQAILDQPNMSTTQPSGAEISADDYYIPEANLGGLNPLDLSKYIWSDEPQFTHVNGDWTETYSNIYKTNVVLSTLEEIKRLNGDEVAWNNVKGHALLIRANSFMQAANIWTLAYNSPTAHSDLGLPLRLDPDFSNPSVRSNAVDTWGQIINDLKAAAPLLPITPIHVLRPSRRAAYALLARAYLSMRIYDSAAHFATICLSENSTLFDFNTLPSTLPTFPFSPSYSNPEIIMDMSFGAPRPLTPGFCRIDSSLYRSYHQNDIRKKAYFLVNNDNSIRFRGSLEGSNSLLTGPTTSEILLIRAECYARKGGSSVTQSLVDINTLLEKRYVNGTFQPYSISDANELLDTILVERRRELLMRNLRFADLKRLNIEGRGIIPSRRYNGQQYFLEPNSNKYALLIPEQVIQQSGIKQNPR